MHAPESQRPQDRTSHWIALASSWLMGSAVGMGTGLVSTEIGYRGVAVVAATGGMGLAAVWLRARRRQDSRVVVLAVRSLLFVAMLGVVAATMLSARAAGFAVLVAALATLGATLIRSEPADRFPLLSGVAMLAIGGGMIASGISPTDPRITSNGQVAFVMIGGLFAFAGLLVIWAGRSFIGFAEDMFRVMFRDAQPGLWAMGVFSVLGAAVTAAQGEFLLATAGILFGVGTFAFLFGYGRRRHELVGLGAVAAGMAGPLSGVGAIVDGDVLFGAAMAGVGVAFVSAGVTFLSRRGQLSRLRRWLEASRPHSHPR